MRASAIILTAMTTVAINGYQVDPNLTDGVYFIPALNLTGSGKLTQHFGAPMRVGDISNPQTGSSSKVEFDVVGEVPVPADSHTCYDATENGVDHIGARDALKKTCNDGAWVPGWRAEQSGIILARYASSLAFVCNWSTNTQACAPNEIEDAYTQISNNCDGETKGGHICASSWKKCYGHSTVMGEICDNDV
ncbi:uncharacterized protein GGS22DRAFT_155354 [Annulohypoxylon maeteangense]|uniref:uncharacterized protein n=1 Tax=Annulohypoxylon maeteangense TaxID=1927788 RepID=UPI00200814DF|nr:uncharacterized protein GGS22DRAFT_155354 [Annulohypoxylon maeteangense]KAI0888218.1 hypothetical protein GGS22DRAFT_155354 [Annulohypoxylon maeteangense]